jgi:hypothetical protein
MALSQEMQLPPPNARTDVLVLIHGQVHIVIDVAASVSMVVVKRKIVKAALAP